MKLSEWKDVWTIASSIVQIAAIAGGAAASYYLFWRRRQVYPRAALSLKVRQYRSARNTILIRATVRIKNIGDVLIQLERGFANLCQLAPCDRQFNDELILRQSATEETPPEVVAPLITKLRFAPREACEIEPHECEVLHFDFVVERGRFRLLKLDVHFKNSEKQARTVGWSRQLIFEVKSYPTSLATKFPVTRGAYVE